VRRECGKGGATAEAAIGAGGLAFAHPDRGVASAGWMSAAPARAERGASVEVLRAGAGGADRRSSNAGTGNRACLEQLAACPPSRRQGGSGALACCRKGRWCWQNCQSGALRCFSGGFSPRSGEETAAAACCAFWSRSTGGRSWIDKPPTGFRSVRWVRLRVLGAGAALSAVGGVEPGARHACCRGRGRNWGGHLLELSEWSGLGSSEPERWPAGLLASANLDPYPLPAPAQFSALAPLRGR